MLNKGLASLISMKVTGNKPLLDEAASFKPSYGELKDTLGVAPFYSPELDLVQVLLTSSLGVKVQFFSLNFFIITLHLPWHGSGTRRYALWGFVTC